MIQIIFVLSYCNYSSVKHFISLKLDLYLFLKSLVNQNTTNFLKYLKTKYYLVSDIWYLKTFTLNYIVFPAKK